MDVFILYRGNRRHLRIDKERSEVNLSYSQLDEKGTFALNGMPLIVLLDLTDTD